MSNDAHASAFPPRHVYSASAGRFEIHAEMSEIGEDLLTVVWGGTRPHIGAIGFAEPRPSFKDPAKTSATSSVIAFAGHKEGDIAKSMAEALARHFRKKAVVTAGIHWDDLTESDIAVVESLCSLLLEKMVHGPGHESYNLNPSDRAE
jgi:gallate decarboxylase subunit D